MLRRWLVVFSLLSVISTPVTANADEFGGSHDTRPQSAVMSDLFDAEMELALTADGRVDYHPTVDRWTDTNNRIRLTPLMGAWFFSGELDVEHNFVTGARVSWEVPGFIAIHFDTLVSPLARLEVKPGGSANAASSRHVDGNVISGYVSVAIFNPELSSENLAWWAGLGVGGWYMLFEEDNVQNSGIQTEVEFEEILPAGKVFIELDYKISDNFHIGLGIAAHVLYSTHTDDGRFYDVNDVKGGVAAGGALTQDGRNDGFVGHLSLVTELTLNLSLVF